MPRNSNYKQVKPQDPGVCAKKLSKPLQAFRPEQIENKEREKKNLKPSQTDTPRPTKPFPFLPKPSKIHIHPELPKTQKKLPIPGHKLAGRRRRRTTASKHKSFPP